MLRFLLDDLSKPHASAKESLALLQRFHNVLVAHLKLEDQWLYPRLLRSDNEIVRGKAERYQKDMGGVRDHFLQLWKQWSRPEAIAEDREGWAQEWQGFAQGLERRIDIEDDDLYVAAEADLG